MNLFIDNKSGAPIYEQLYTQIKNQILSGELQPEEAMPSIRGLARICASVLLLQSGPTMSWNRRAFCMRCPPRVFRGGGKHRAAPGREPEKIEAHLTEAVRLAAPCGLTKQELTEMLELLWEE